MPPSTIGSEGNDLEDSYVDFSIPSPAQVPPMIGEVPPSYNASNVALDEVGKHTTFYLFAPLPPISFIILI